MKERKKHYCNNKETYEETSEEFDDRAAANKDESAHYFTEAVYIKVPPVLLGIDFTATFQGFFFDYMRAARGGIERDAHRPRAARRCSL